MQAAESPLVRIQAGEGQKGVLRAMVPGGGGTGRRLEAFMVDLDGPALPRGGAEWDVRATGLDGASHAPRRGAGAGACELPDRRRGRPCMAHTAAPDGDAGETVSLLARVTGLSRSWICPSVLGCLAGAAGNGAAARLSRESGGRQRGLSRAARGRRRAGAQARRQCHVRKNSGWQAWAGQAPASGQELISSCGTGRA